MKNKLFITISIVSGIALTIILGFIPFPTGDLIGTQKWGYPIYWLNQAIYPGAPIEILWLIFLFDCIVWIFSIYLVIKIIDFLIGKYKKNN
ncbi:MAG: hypothetical protein ACFE8E_05525 [Candidatus Hodarchaeota archaeon]